MPNWKKIKNLSFDELRVRASQKWSAFGERHSVLSLGRLPDDRKLLTIFHNHHSGSAFPSVGVLLDYFRQRPLKFFTSFENRDATTQVQKEEISTADQVLASAQGICEGRFDLLGLKGLQFGTPPQWNLEPVLDKQTPQIHWSKLDYLDARLAGDKKIIWELNRHQYFMILGRAYWLTGDEKYSEVFAEHLESWLDQNTPKLGINWASSLEVSFRAISWLWSFHFFRHSPKLNSALFSRALKYLYLHGRHLETYLSTYFSPNTHLTGEALGLYYLATVFPEFSDAQRWKTLGRKILLDQLPIHVQQDGVYFEQSSYYHRYTSDFYLHFLLLSRLNQESESPLLLTSLEKLLEHLMYITRPDGTSPLYGDDDGGRLVMLAENAPDDFRAALSTGAVLLGRPDFKFVANNLSEETLWLLGPQGVERFAELEARPPEHESRAFVNSGYFIMRDGWDSHSNYLLFDCGPHGTANCGHAHADALSFDLAANGKTLLVDPGTYTYTGSKELRDSFRSSSAHNTLTIDGESSSISEGPFSWKTISRCEAQSWIESPHFDYVEGTHDGYSSRPSPAAHTRSILFLKKEYWVVCDRVKATGTARLDVNFHFSSDSEPCASRQQNGEVRIVENKKSNLELAVFGSAGDWKQEESFVSNCYAQKSPSTTWVFSTTVDSGETTLVTLLLPFAEFPNNARRIESRGGLALEIASEKWTDFLLLRKEKLVETSKLRSDFDLLWARFLTGDTKSPAKVVGIGGANVDVNGENIVKLKKNSAGVYAESGADGLYRIELSS